MTLGVVAFPGALDTVGSLSDVTNGAQTVMASNGGSVSSGATTINVTSTSLFPSANGSLVIDSEIIYYTGTTATSFTGCLRGQNGTSAASHNDGAVVDCYILAAHFTLLRDMGIAIETKLGSGSSTPSAGLYLRGNGTGTSAWSSLSSSDIITGLGYTPMNPAAANTLTAADTALSVTNNASIGGQFNVNGLVGLNGPTVATSGVHISGGVMSGSSQYGLEIIPLCSSIATTAFYGLYVNTAVGNVSFTQTNNYGIYIGNVAKGALATITNAYGLYIESITQGGTLNHSLHVAGGLSYFGGDVSALDLLLTSTADPGSPANGELWYNSTIGNFKRQTPIGAGSALTAIQATIPSSDSVTGTVSETAFATNCVIPAASMTVGKILRITARGNFVSTSTFTLQFVLRLTNGGTHIVLATAVATAVTALASPGGNWTIDAVVQITALGSGTSATANCYMRRAWTTVANTGSANEGTAGIWRGNAIGFDSTLAQTLELTAKWSSTSPTVTMEYFEVTALN